jgi:hypothetical protein
MAMVNKVRPWNAPVNEITSERPVAARAILTAFSIASAPVVTSSVFLGPDIGAIRLSASASST